MTRIDPRSLPHLRAVLQELEVQHKITNPHVLVMPTPLGDTEVLAYHESPDGGLTIPQIKEKFKGVEPAFVGEIFSAFRNARIHGFEFGANYPEPLFYGSFEEIRPDILWLWLRVVHPSFQKQGIGSAFYQDLLSLALLEGFRFIGHDHKSLEAAQTFLKSGALFWEDIDPELQSYITRTRRERSHPDFHTVISFVHQKDRERFAAVPAYTSTG